MMEDTGEDLLRQKPNIVSSLFKRLGQVRNLLFVLVLQGREEDKSGGRLSESVLLACCRLISYGWTDGPPMPPPGGFLL